MKAWAFRVQGLVFRLESFAKMLAPGFRIGWVTGPKRFIEARRDSRLKGKGSRVLRLRIRSNQSELRMRHSR